MQWSWIVSGHVSAHISEACNDALSCGMSHLHNAGQCKAALDLMSMRDLCCAAQLQ